MFIKHGDAEIINVIDPSETEDDDNRKLVLDNALNNAKGYVPAKETFKEIAMEN